MDSDFSADHLCELIKKDLHQPFEHAKSEHGRALDPEEGPEEALIDALRRRGLSSRQQMERELGWEGSKTLKYLNALAEKRLTKKIGGGPTTRYRAT